MRVLAIILFGGILLPLGAATLNVPILEIPKLNPYQGNEANMNKVLNQVAEGLVGLDESLSPIPLLAQSWKVDIQNKAITFTLKDKKFHDGSTVTPKDVLNCLKQSQSRKSNLISQVKDISILSRKKIKIVLNDNNFPFFLKKLTSIEGLVFKKNKGKFLGTGPYRIVEISDMQVLLKRVSTNSYYEGISACLKLLQQML